MEINQITAWMSSSYNNIMSYVSDSGQRKNHVDHSQSVNDIATSFDDTVTLAHNNFFAQLAEWENADKGEVDRSIAANRIREAYLETYLNESVELDLSRLNISSLPTLPNRLEKLYLIECTSLQTLPQLPDNLRWLALGGCTSLQALPQLPDTLEKLFLGGCTSLRALPQLPDSLSLLDLRGSSFQTLPQLPNGLRKLYLSDSTSLKALPNLPNGLHLLDLGGCTSLKALPNLPNDLRELNLGGCTSLPALPQHLPNSLEHLTLDDGPLALQARQHQPPLSNRVLKVKSLI